MEMSMQDLRDLIAPTSSLSATQSSPSIAARFVGQYVIVRSGQAGVFAGVLDAVDGDQVILAESRKLWSWTTAKGIAVQAIAEHGLKDGRLTELVPVQLVGGVHEIVPASALAEKSIRGMA